MSFDPTKSPTCLFIFVHFVNVIFKMAIEKDYKFVDLFIVLLVITTQVDYTRVTNAHGHSPQPIASRSPTYNSFDLFRCTLSSCMTAVRPNLANFNHFSKTLKAFLSAFEDVISIWQNCEHCLAIFVLLGKVSLL